MKRYAVVDARGKRVSTSFASEDDAIAEMYRLAGSRREVPFRVVAVVEHYDIGGFIVTYPDGSKDWFKHELDANSAADMPGATVEPFSGDNRAVWDTITAKRQAERRQQRQVIGDSSGRFGYGALRQFLQTALRDISGTRMKDIPRDSTGGKGIRVSFAPGDGYLADALEQGLRGRGFHNVSVRDAGGTPVLEVRTQ